MDSVGGTSECGLGVEVVVSQEHKEADQSGRERNDHTRAPDWQYARVAVDAGKRVSLQHTLSAMATVPSTSALAPSTSTAWKASNPKNAQVQHALKPAPTVDLPALQGAGRVIHEQLVKDAQAVPELGDMLTIRVFYVPCADSLV